jgi:hypothetical protein
MCTRCGRPQQAGAGRCAACGAELPEAPLPPATVPATSPFLSVELGGGRVLTGEGNRLAFRPGASATPFLQELPSLRRLSLVRESRLEAFALAAGALVALLFLPWEPVRVLLGLLVLASVAFASGWRRYRLLLESVGGVETWWELGTVRRGSSAERRLRDAWALLAEVLRARGVQVHEPPPGGRAPGA